MVVIKIGVEEQGDGSLQISFLQDGGNGSEAELTMANCLKAGIECAMEQAMIDCGGGQIVGKNLTNESRGR